MPEQAQAKRPLRWLLLTALVLVLDFATKQLALRFLHPYQPVPIFPSFNLTLVFNPGAAFSFLSHSGDWQRWFLSLVAIVIVMVLMAWMRKLPANRKLALAGLALIIGGALGNLCDRLVLGVVIDFIDVYFKNYHWPAFNIADSAICIGVLLLVIDLFVVRKRRRQAVQGNQ